MAKQNIAVVMTTGTNDPLKTELAVLTAFGMRKNGHNVSILMMGEAGHVIDEDMLRACNGYGLPPIAKILDDECMKDITWYIWEFCANARKMVAERATRKVKMVSAVEGAKIMADADKALIY